MKRIEAGVTRPAPFTLDLDGAPVAVHPGETIAVAILASGTQRFRDDHGGRPRGMFCNMGTCSECIAWVARAGQDWRRLRTCLVPAEPGMRVATTEPGEAPEAAA